MSVIVSIGQGGNQLAACFWQRAEQYQQSQKPVQKKSIASTAASASSSSNPPLPPRLPASPFFSHDAYAHAVLIDAEPKVVNSVLRLGEEIHSKSASRSAAAASATTASGSAASSSSKPSSSSKSSSAASSIFTSPPSTTPYTSLFRPTNHLYEQHGRGNNFSMGYAGRFATEGCEDSLLDRSMQAIRKEVERMDACSSIVAMHSLAGGTGSGLGSRVIEELRDTYPDQTLLSCSIAPFGAGDTPLQHYNSLLCMSHIYPCLDGVILANNHDITRALSSMTVKDSAIASSSSANQYAPAMAFAGINTYLSACLTDILAPTATEATTKQIEKERQRERMKKKDGDRSATTATAFTSDSLDSSSSSSPISSSIRDLLSHVAPQPAYKLLEIWSSVGLGAPPSSSSSAAAAIDPRAPPLPAWKSCMDVFKRCVPPEFEDAECEPATLGYTIYARGDSAVDPIDSCVEQLSTRFARLFPLVHWQQSPPEFILTHLPRMTYRSTQPKSALSALHADKQPQHESTRSLSACINRTRTALTLRPSIDKARLLLENKAYLHWYTRYGLEESDMHDAIEMVEQIVQDYAGCDRR